MTRNIAIGCAGSGNTYSASRRTSALSLTSANSNVSTTWSLSTSSVPELNTTFSYTTPAISCSQQYGAWYNYAATTAGTISNGSQDMSPQVYDVCPKNWKLPNNDHMVSLTSLGISGSGIFNPVTGGMWYKQSIQEGSENRANWWLSDAKSDNYIARYVINYTPGENKFNGSINAKDIGVYVRCVAK